MNPDETAKLEIINRMVRSIPLSSSKIASFYFEVEYEGGVKIAEKRTFLKVEKKKKWWDAWFKI